MNYSAEMYKQITGQYPPKPFAEKTDEERRQDREHFFAIVNASPDDGSADDFIENARMNPVLQQPDFHDEE